MKPTVFWVVVMAAGMLACSALAAPVVLSSAKVGGGNTSAVACDTDGFTPSYTTSRGNVSAVTVGGIASPACGGGALRVTVTNTSGASIATGGPQTIPAGSTSVAVSLSPQPAASQVAGVEIIVEGP